MGLGVGYLVLVFAANGLLQLLLVEEKGLLISTFGPKKKTFSGVQNKMLFSSPHLKIQFCPHIVLCYCFCKHDLMCISFPFLWSVLNTTISKFPRDWILQVSIHLTICKKLSMQ